MSVKNETKERKRGRKNNYVFRESTMLVVGSTIIIFGIRFAHKVGIGSNKEEEKKESTIFATLRWFVGQRC